jgi:predicted metal-dependent peptidase
MFVMEHEFMHIIDGHLELPPDLRARFGQTKVNYAADIVVNQQCTVSPCELENSLVTHKRYKFPENLDIYGYLDLLPEFKEDPNAPGNDLEMPSVSGPSPETVEQDVRQAAKEAVERGAAGDTTERFKKALEPKPGAFDLAMCFSNFVNIVAKSERTLRKRLTSRRYKIPPGSRSIPKSMPGIYFGCDVSGSMDDRDIETFYGALRIVHRKISGIVGQFDTEVFKDSEKILQEAVADDIINREGHGGTSFVPVFERANELGFAGCVLFTDTWGEFPDRYDGQALVVVPEHIMGDRCNVPAWAKIVPLRARE